MKSQKKQLRWLNRACCCNTRRYDNGYNYDGKKYPGAEETCGGTGRDDESYHQCEDTAEYWHFLWCIDRLTRGCDLPGFVPGERGDIPLLKHYIGSDRRTSHQLFRLYNHPGR